MAGALTPHRPHCREAAIKIVHQVFRVFEADIDADAAPAGELTMVKVPRAGSGL